MSPNALRLPAVARDMRATTQRFINKVQKKVPKGQVNHSDTISFLERILSNQDGIKTLHNAFTRKKNSLYS